jgi:hypothetical protein
MNPFSNSLCTVSGFELSFFMLSRFQAQPKTATLQKVSVHAHIRHYHALCAYHANTLQVSPAKDLSTKAKRTQASTK